MTFVLEPLLTPDQLAKYQLTLSDPGLPWTPGRETAGWHARLVKSNHQLPRDSAVHQTLSQDLADVLMLHPLVQARAFPVRVHSLLFSRCGVGEGYGRHIDNAWMAGGRSDLSFTLALSDPGDYSGGELVLETENGESRLRLPAGHAVIYPSTLHHRVEPVSTGERLVAVGWIQSRIRGNDQRELLFELDTARRLQFQAQGKDEVFDLISRSYTNLLRRWDC
ncbi:MAG: hypothetical protein RLZZ216_327 [Cyanobacteriota bacterium]|jgi:PKHD-type hydroxylase